MSAIEEVITNHTEGKSVHIKYEDGTQEYLEYDIADRIIHITDVNGIEKFIEYDKIRNKVGKYYDLEKYGNNAYWSIDFQAKIITITINDNAE